MKIEILKNGLKNSDTGKSLKVGEKITVSDKRGQKAIDRGVAKEVETTNKKSQQKKVEDSLEKK